MNSLILVIVGLIVVVFLAMLFAVLRLNSAKRKARLMKVMRGEAGSDKKRQAISTDQRRAELAKKLKESSAEEGKQTKAGNLSSRLMQAGLKISVLRFWIYAVLSGCIICLVSVFFGFGPFVASMMAIIGVFGLPRLIVKMMINHRQKKFIDDFADALDSMQRLLKAGMPVSEAIKMVAREYTGPIGEEMEYIFEQQKIGIPLPEAVLECARRIPLAEVNMFSTAIAIQTQTGSSLSEVLENLSGVIRARFRLKRKVQALSSEAKASAGIIGALPILVTGGLYMINPNYITILFTDPFGKVLLFGAIFWMCIGMIIMRQMINFKV